MRTRKTLGIASPLGRRGILGGATAKLGDTLAPSEALNPVSLVPTVPLVITEALGVPGQTAESDRTGGGYSGSADVDSIGGDGDGGSSAGGGDAGSAGGTGGDGSGDGGAAGDGSGDGGTGDGAGDGAGDGGSASGDAF